MKLVIAIAIVAALGCEKSRSDAPEPAPSPSNDGVQLVSLGSEPKQLLRYHLKAGTHAPLVMAMDLDLEISPRPMKMPTIAMTLDIAVDEVRADGSARITTTIKGVQLKDRPGATVDAAALSPMTAMLSGVGYTFELGPDGTVTKSQVTGSPPSQFKAQLDDMTRAIEQVAMRVPVVPVGLGATWSSKKTVQQNGVSITTVTTTELTKLEADRFEFTSTTTLSAPDQKVSQGGIEMDVKDVGGGGTSKGSVELTTMALHGAITSEFRGSVTAAGTTSQMRVVMGLTLN